MAAKLIVTILTAAALVVLGACGLFFAVIALNGYSGAQGGRILMSYVVCGLLVTACGAGASWLGYAALAGRFNWPPLAAGPVAFIVSTAGGLVALVAGFFLSLLIFGRVS